MLLVVLAEALSLSLSLSQRPPPPLAEVVYNILGPGCWSTEALFLKRVSAEARGASRKTYASPAALVIWFITIHLFTKIFIITQHYSPLFTMK